MQQPVCWRHPCRPQVRACSGCAPSFDSMVHAASMPCMHVLLLTCTWLSQLAHEQTVCRPTESLLEPGSTSSAPVSDAAPKRRSLMARLLCCFIWAATPALTRASSVSQWHPPVPQPARARVLAASMACQLLQPHRPCTRAPMTERTWSAQHAPPSTCSTEPGT